MRSKTIFGALLVSVALCSQGFGFELLDRMLGLNGGGCGECNACARSPPVQPCAKTCAPKPPAARRPPCCASAARKCRPTPVRDLFANIKDMFEAKGCQCEPVAAAKPQGLLPGTGLLCEAEVLPQGSLLREGLLLRRPAARRPAVRRPAVSRLAARRSCKPKCHKLYRRPVLELLENLFGCDECCN